MRIKATFLAMLMGSALMGCVRGVPSDSPPVHINPNMFNQPKFRPQSENQFFADNRGMRQPVAGTVARGHLDEDDTLYRGLGADGRPIVQSPIQPTADNLKRGQERYNIYCSVCHGRAGDGQGIMLKKGYVPPPSFHSDLIRNFPDGHIFSVISNGVRNMPAYGPQIPVEDRWLIVNYLRVLQRSQNASISDVPLQERDRLGK